VAELVQKVQAASGDLRVDIRQPDPRLVEAVRDRQLHALGNRAGNTHRPFLRLDLAGASPLVAAQLVQRLLVGIERRNQRAFRRGEEVRDAPIPGADRRRCGDGLFGTFGLDRDVPAQGVAGDREVPGRTGQVPAVVVPDPAELGQPDAAARLVDPEACNVGFAKTIALALALKLWMAALFLEEALEGGIQVDQRRLQGVNRRFLQEAEFLAVASGGQPFPRLVMIGVGFAALMPCLQLGQGLVPDEAATPGKTAQQSRLLRAGAKQVFKSLPDCNIAHALKPKTMDACCTRTILPCPEVARVAVQFAQRRLPACVAPHHRGARTCCL